MNNQQEDYKKEQINYNVRVCIECHGTGKIEKLPCPFCDGRGELDRVKPKEFDEQSSVKYRRS